VADELDNRGWTDAEDDAHDAADAGEQDGLDEELDDDVCLAGAQGAADADLAGALGDGGEHDVHDADAADEQGDGGDGAEHDGENALGALRLLEQLDRNDDAPVLFFVVGG
jgi:hypothetical protein